MNEIQWYTQTTETGRIEALCGGCAAEMPVEAAWQPADDETVTLECCQCGRLMTDDDDIAQIRQALRLAHAQLEMAVPILTERRRRRLLQASVMEETSRSYTNADDAWQRRSRALLEVVRRWLDACDLSADGPSRLQEGHGDDD